MTRHVSFISSSVLVFFLGVCAAVAIEPIKDISQEDLITLIKSDQDYLLLDVRSDDEYGQGHIETAMHINFRKVESHLSQLLEFKNKPVVIYCEIGGRASRAEEVLIEAGFSNVRQLSGHYRAWRDSSHAE